MSIFAVVCILVCFLINPLLGILVAVLVIGCMLVPKPKNEKTPKKSALDHMADARKRNNWDN